MIISPVTYLFNIFQADNIIMIASSRYKAFTKGKGKWRSCFFSDSMKPSNDDNETGYHIPLIYSLMLDEHKRTKKELNGKDCRRFLCLLLSESTKKDIPKWLKSYPSFIWPNHFKPFLHCILKIAEWTWFKWMQIMCLKLLNRDWFKSKSCLGSMIVFRRPTFN